MEFKNTAFSIDNNKIRLTKLGNLLGLSTPFVQVHVAGENKDSHMGAKLAASSEGKRLEYVAHHIAGDTLTVVQKSELIEAVTNFTGYDDTNALRICTAVKNISDHPIVLEEVSAFAFTGIPVDGDFTRFLQSHHKECQPVTRSLASWGLTPHEPNGQKRIAFANVGSWSTKEELPQGILAYENGQLMFQIESAGSWYYEISDLDQAYYLYLGGANLPFGGWARKLESGEEYITPSIALAFGTDLNDVLANMTRYRRHIAGNYVPDQKLPAIFNEYMHLSWDSPTAQRTQEMAKLVSDLEAEYYVIDCGWHNEEPGNEIYPYVGQWKESKARFPEGVRKTLDHIRSLGMKPGLWIEPEIIGDQCEEMLDYYEDDCFFQRFGRPVTVMGRRFLDYRNPKVRAYMTETIRRMVEDYGADYIKFDYNQDAGVGTDYNAFTPGEGLEKATEAFFDWVGEMHRKYPDVVFEGCASGGMRMDHRSLPAFSLLSTSDQTKYLLYPYIAGNILSAVLPEQAAVWSYPVTEDCKGEDVSDDRIGMNMINSFLGRMHLASHLERLNEHQLQLIREGIDYYNSLTEMKKRAVPYFPNSFTHFGAENVCAGLRDGDKIYLAVWNLTDAGQVRAEIAGAKSVKIGYPSDSDATGDIANDHISVNFPRENMAVFLEITL